MEVKQRSGKIARPCWWDVEVRRAEVMRVTEAGPVKQRKLRGCGCRVRNFEPQGCCLIRDMTALACRKTSSMLKGGVKRN